MSNNEIGEKVRKWRTSRGWTQAELAHRVGIGVSTVAHIEGGTRRPSWENLLRLMSVFDSEVRLLEPDAGVVTEELSAEEREVVEAIRKLRRSQSTDDHRRADVLRLLATGISHATPQVLDFVLTPLAKSLSR